ncbi:hypothetical protein [Spirillospora sp. CA-294931]|uniref:hypothetical protein n=1 Tax=Spirillospora sp. CA-294931 TaxID=3240042 RepID=UPI003D94E3A0
MSEDSRKPEKSPSARWSKLPPRTDLKDTVGVQEVPPKPEVIVNPRDVETEFAIRHVG